MPDLTIFVCTYNSAGTLEGCLRNVAASEPDSLVVVVDQNSTDSSVEIARKFDVEIHLQNVGLGFARQLCFELTKTKYLAFVDGDEEIVQTSFFRKAIEVLPEVPSRVRKSPRLEEDQAGGLDEAHARENRVQSAS